MSTSPPPEEREKKDAEARAREKEEQAKLPYKWTQTIGDVDITVPVAGNLKGRDLDVVVSKTKLKVAVKGQEPFIDVRQCHVGRELSPTDKRLYRVPCPSQYTPMNPHGH